MSRASKFGLISALLLSVLCAVQAYAWPPTFGKEFNFTNQTLVDAWRARDKATASPDRVGDEWQTPGPEEQAAADHFAKTVKELCQDECTVTDHPGKFKSVEHEVRFKNGWGFTISVDPAVVEIQTMPETTDQIDKNTELYKQYIFKAAEAAGLGTASLRDEELVAHLNVGFRSAFDNDPRKFMRFFIDYANYPSLAMGILGQDLRNAPLLSSLDKEQLLALKNIVDDVNSGKIKTADEATYRINVEVYTKSPKFKDAPESTARHNQALGLKNMVTEKFRTQDMPFEFRAIRQDLDATQYPLLAKLIARRIEFTNSQKSRIVFDPENIAAHKLDPLSMATEFYVYTTEMKENWKDYEALLSPAIKEELQKGVIQSAFSENIDLTQPRQKEVFDNYIAKNRLNSRWVDEQFSKQITLKNFPIKPFSAVMTEAKRTIETKPGQARRILAAFDNLPEEERQNLSITKLGKIAEVEALRDRIPPPAPDFELVVRKQNSFQRFINCASQKIKSMLQ